MVGNQQSLKTLGGLWLPVVHVDRSKRWIGDTSLNIFSYIKYEDKSISVFILVSNNENN